jgi:signal transduction histidine kinase
MTVPNELGGSSSEIRHGGDLLIILLEGRSFPELANALRSHPDEVVRRWVESVRQVLPAADKLTLSQVMDHVPVVLGQLANVLGSINAEEVRKFTEGPAAHAVTRFHQEYSVRELVIEYRLLRQIAVEVIEEALNRRLSTPEDLALDMGIDAMLQRSVVAYVEHLANRLREATEIETKYLSFISHDVRNNLNSVTLALELLKRRLATRPEFAEEMADLDGVRQSTLETMAGMDRLLQAERLRQQPQPKVEAVKLRAMAAEVVQQSSAQAQKKGLALAVEVPAHAILNSDRDWIKMVLQNLVGNAVKYSSKGTVRISAEPRRDAEGWVISVSDEGPGIAEDQLHHLFEAFERGETHGQAGLGLGLAIASQAAKVLGGQLIVESKAGVGTTFRLTLPELGGGQS